jgi:hypothetical protein
MGSWIASFFLGFRVAFGRGGQLDVVVLALLKGYRRTWGEGRGEKGEKRIKERKGIQKSKVS